MNHRRLALLAVAAIALWPAAVAAQANRQPRYVTPPLRDDEQIMPSQVVEPPPPAKPKPPADEANLTDPDAKAPPAKPAPPKPAEPARAVACSAGAFAKHSGHLRLAQVYGAHNVDFTQVSGDDGSTLMASVIFPNDPKRRL